MTCAVDRTGGGAAAAATSDSTSVAVLIAQREQELAQLRANSIATLEQQVAGKDVALAELQARLEVLQADHERSLAQLEERDGELAQREGMLKAVGAELTATRDLVGQMQAALSEAEQALTTEHAARTAAERQLAQQRRILAQEAQQARAAGEAALRQQQHAADVRERQLEGELQRAATAAAEQQRVTAAAHQADLQQLEVEYTEHLRQLQLRAEVAEQLVQRRDAEVQAANEQLRAQAVQLAALQAQARSLDKELQAAEQDRTRLEQQLGEERREHAGQASELRSTAEALRNALEDQRADSAEQLRRSQAQLGEQAAAAQAEAEAARHRVQQVGCELEEARAALEVQHAALQQQLERICAERESQLAAAHKASLAEQQQEGQHLAAALAEAQGKAAVLAERHAALHDFVEQQQQELLAARGELGHATAACEQLQAQLDAADRRAAVLAAGQGPSLPELEGMLRRLTAQRDIAQVAAAKAQAQLAAQQAEIQRLERQVAAAATEPSAHFSLPSGLSSSESLAEPPPVAAEVAVLQKVLAAERQQTRQLQEASHALTADMQLLQQQQQQQPLAVVPTAGPGHTGGGEALADVTNTDPHRQQRRQQLEVQRLVKLAGRAQVRLRQLTAENERLMEVSNSLRAEQSRLAQAAGGGDRGSAGDGRDGRGALPPGPVPVPGFLLPPNLWPLLALPVAGQPLQLVVSCGGSSGQSRASRAEQKPEQQAQQVAASGQQQQQQQQQQQAAAARLAPLPPAEDLQKMAVVGMQLREAGRAPAAAGPATAHAGGGACRQQERQLAAGKGGSPAKQPSPPRVRNWNLRDDP